MTEFSSSRVTDLCVPGAVRLPPSPAGGNPRAAGRRSLRPAPGLGPQPTPRGHRAREGSGSQPCRGSRTSLLRREPQASERSRMPIQVCHCPASHLPMTRTTHPELWKLLESNPKALRGAGPAHLSSQLPTPLPVHSFRPLGAFTPSPGTCPRTFALILSLHGFPQIRLGSPPQLGARGTPPPRGLPGLRSSQLPSQPLRGLGVRSPPEQPVPPEMSSFAPWLTAGPVHP